MFARCVAAGQRMCAPRAGALRALRIDREYSRAELSAALENPQLVRSAVDAYPDTVVE